MNYRDDPGWHKKPAWSRDPWIPVGWGPDHGPPGGWLASGGLAASEQGVFRGRRMAARP